MVGIPPIRSLCLLEEVRSTSLKRGEGDRVVAVKKRKSATKSKTARQSTLSPEGIIEPFNIDDVPWKRLRGSTAFKRLGAHGDGSQVGVGIDVLKPGQYSNRFHYHLKDEEHIFILKGRVTLILGFRGYIMKERDYCCFPAGQRAGHHLFNHTDEKCLFMTIGDHHADDIACFPNSGKARIRATGKTVPISKALSDH
jgi:uncharacterized cupin superfamily protein